MTFPDPVDPSVGQPTDELTEGLRIHVDGHDEVYTATDLDGDGLRESVYVGPTEESTAGGYAYTDTTGDGVADSLTQFDAAGGVLSHAVFDEATGQWRQEPGGEPGQPMITIDTPDGPRSAGPATYDTDGDGVKDTSVAATVDGTTLVITDTDGDGAADVVTEVASDGSFTSLHHTGDGEWTAVDQGNLADGLDDGAPAAGPVTTDPGTGRWTNT